MAHSIGVANQSLQLYEAVEESDSAKSRSGLDLAKRMILEAMEQTRDLSHALGAAGAVGGSSACRRGPRSWGAPAASSEPGAGMRVEVLVTLSPRSELFF